MSVIVSAAIGVGLTYARWFELAPETLVDVRRTLVIACGAVFFGAGLIQLSVWRVDRSTTRGEGGVVLVVFGFGAAFLSGQGPLLHESITTMTLNPLAAALASVTTLAALATTRRDAARGALRPGVAAPVWLGVTAAGFGGMVALRHLAGISLDPSPAVQMALELSIATLWFFGAAVVAGRDEGSAEAADAAILSALGCAWLMRAGAVVDPGAWGLASGVLLGLVSVVALTRAMAELTEATESEQERMRAAERALAQATEALETAEHHRRDIRHGSRNAMLALRLATQTLAEHGERLDSETRTRLSKSVVDEVAHLEQLLTQRLHPAAGASLVRIPAQRERS